MAFSVSSQAFGNGEPIPKRHSRAGGNVSPALEWRDAPPGTKSFVLIVEDPDAPRGTFRHWAIFNIPGATTELPEGAGFASTESLKHGVNDFGNAQYDGPQPPPGPEEAEGDVRPYGVAHPLVLHSARSRSAFRGRCS